MWLDQGSKVPRKKTELVTSILGKYKKLSQSCLQIQQFTSLLCDIITSKVSSAPKIQTLSLCPVRGGCLPQLRVQLFSAAPWEQISFLAILPHPSTPPLPLPSSPKPSAVAMQEGRKAKWDRSCLHFNAVIHLSSLDLALALCALGGVFMLPFPTPQTAAGLSGLSASCRLTSLGSHRPPSPSLLNRS